MLKHTASCVYGTYQPVYARSCYHCVWPAATMKQAEETVAQAALKDTVAARIALIKQLLGDADGDILATHMRFCFVEVF